MTEPAASSVGTLPLDPEPARHDRIRALAGCAAFVALFMLALAWAKWIPYLAKLEGVWGTGIWSGKDLLANAGPAGSAPSLDGASWFVGAYAESVWPAVVAALLIAAAVEAILPRRVLLWPARRGGELRRSLVGGLASQPSLTCTCCTAPVAVSLPRQGVPRATALSYWVGNPVLNPWSSAPSPLA